MTPAVLNVSGSRPDFPERSMSVNNTSSVDFAECLFAQRNALSSSLQASGKRDSGSVQGKDGSAETEEKPDSRQEARDQEIRSSGLYPDPIREDSFPGVPGFGAVFHAAGQEDSGVTPAIPDSVFPSLEGLPYGSLPESFETVEVPASGISPESVTIGEMPGEMPVEKGAGPVISDSGDTLRREFVFPEEGRVSENLEGTGSRADFISMEASKMLKDRESSSVPVLREGHEMKGMKFGGFESHVEMLSGSGLMEGNVPGADEVFPVSSEYSESPVIKAEGSEERSDVTLLTDELFQSDVTVSLLPEPVDGSLSGSALRVSVIPGESSGGIQGMVEMYVPERESSGTVDSRRGMEGLTGSSVVFGSDVIYRSSVSEPVLVSPGQLVDRMVEVMVDFSRRGKTGEKSIEFSISPRSLGDVSVKLRFERGVLYSEFSCTRENAGIVESNLSLLREALSEAGVAFGGGSMSVNVSDGGSKGHSGDWSGSGESRRPGRSSKVEDMGHVRGMTSGSDEARYDYLI